MTAAATMTRYACKRDGKIHDMTICGTRKGALELGRMYCCNHFRDSPNADNRKHNNAWTHLLETGRIEIVKIQIREVRS